MYTATVLYEFKEERFGEACRIWETSVLELARRQEGFVRMQFLTASPRALAIGTWRNSSYAQAFMQTGVFKDLLEKLKPMLVGEPRPQIWDLACFAQA
jgi:quinol monooxygenase YgiN